MLLAFSGIRGALTGSPVFNSRVGECERAAAILLRALGRSEHTRILRNVAADEFDCLKTDLGACCLVQAATQLP